MGVCHYCNEKLDSLPFTCKRCGKQFCSKHRLPENHECTHLVRGNIFTNISSTRKIPKGKKFITIPDEPKEDIEQKPPIWEKIKQKYYKTKHFIKKHAWSRITKNILFLIIWILIFKIIFANLLDINQFKLPLIKIGNTLLLITTYFIIRHIYRIFRDFQYKFHYLDGIYKLIIVLILIIFLVHVYLNQEKYIPKTIYYLQQVDYRVIYPFAFTTDEFKDWVNENVMYDKDLDESDASIIQQILYTPPERKEDCQDAFNYVNELREKYGKKQIAWNENAYKLAVDRAKDMFKRGYFDHVTPEGTCVKDMKKEYGFKSSEIIAENLGGMTYYSDGNPVSYTDCKEPVDSWIDSRGHRYNLLYSDHKSGAIGCYKFICVFLGVHNDPYGLGVGPCTTGDEGLAYWESIGKQAGEV